MQLQTVTRTPFALRLGITGTTGSSKTLSALRLAYGLCGNWSKIALIDTGYGAANIYSSEGSFNTLSLGYPYDSLEFLNALILCEERGMEVIIIDSVSDEWTGFGGTLDQFHLAARDTNHQCSVLQLHREFLRALMESEAHILCTFKQDRKGTVLSDHGFLDYLHALLTLEGAYKARAVKDRTGLFGNEEPFTLTSETGCRLGKWCQEETITIPPVLQQKINRCHSLSDLTQLLFSEALEDPRLVQAFTRRRLEIEGYVNKASVLPLPLPQHYA